MPMALTLKGQHVMRKKMILCSLVLVFSFVVEATTGGRSGAPSNPTTKSFKEWKDQKIQEIQTRIDLLQARIDSQLPTDTNLGQLKTQLKNDSYSLEMAKELTVSDYMIDLILSSSHAIHSRAQKKKKLLAGGLSAPFIPSGVEIQQKKTPQN
jgi:hypothetical protein